MCCNETIETVHLVSGICSSHVEREGGGREGGRDLAG